MTLLLLERESNTILTSSSKSENQGQTIQGIWNKLQNCFLILMEAGKSYLIVLAMQI